MACFTRYTTSGGVLWGPFSKTIQHFVTKICTHIKLAVFFQTEINYSKLF